MDNLDGKILERKGLENIKLIFEWASINDSGCEYEDVLKQKLSTWLVPILFEKGPRLSHKFNTDFRGFLLDLLFLLIW